MALSVVTNSTSLLTQMQMNKTSSMLESTLKRLATGKRVNNPADDAAVYAITARQTSRILSFSQAIRNASDGISVVQTASSAINTNIASLQKMRVLALQSLNDTNSSSDRNNLDLEFQQLADSITEVSNSTKFNGQNLLDGSFAGKSFQVGITIEETILMNFSDSRASAIGDYSLTAVAAGSNYAATNLGTAVTVNAAARTDNSIQAGVDMTIAGHLGTHVISDAAWGAAQTSLGTAAAIATSDGMSAEAMAKAINDSSGQHGVTAEARTEATLSGFTATGTITFSMATGTGANQADYNGKLATITAQITDTSDLSALATAINEQKGKTGVRAEIDSDNKNSLKIISDKGANIQLSDVSGSDFTITEQDATTQTLLSNTNDSTLFTGTVEYHSSSSFALQSDSTTVGIASKASDFSMLATQDVKTTVAAKKAIHSIDAALDRLTDFQAVNGSIENRLSVVVSNLESQKLNTTNSRGRMQDADFALETANLSKFQILAQVGAAMAAQANQMPQIALTLLQ